jgi:outer membrane protein
MKKPWLIVNIALIAAIAVLYVLHFTGGKSVVKEERKQTGNSPVTGDLSRSIYYINFDTVLANYDMYLDIQDQLERMAKTSEAELAAKDKAFQKEVADYQSQLQKGLLLRSEAQEREQQLGTIQQQLIKLQENLRLDLAEQQVVANRKVLDSIMRYLTVIQHEYGYKIVLGTQFGGGVLYADDELDITQRVIKGLNDNYRSERTRKEK